MSLVDVLKAGQVAVIPTDTLYGLVGRALDHEAVDRVARLKKRSNNKPFIILISDIADLALFEVADDERVNNYWPGAVSIILPCHSNKYEYLHMGTNSLAFRLPSKPSLLDLLKQTGPLVAPSANPEGMPPSKTIEQAHSYFGDEVAEYVEDGKLNGQPSRLIRFNGHEVDVLR